MNIQQTQGKMRNSGEQASDEVNPANNSKGIPGPRTKVRKLCKITGSTRSKSYRKLVGKQRIMCNSEQKRVISLVRREESVPMT